jgi:lipoprotein-anchoring transpeptidase ErfK/SrfK
VVAIGVLVSAVAMALTTGSMLQPAQAELFPGLLPGILSPPTTKAPPTTKPGPKPHVPVMTWLASPVGEVPTYDAPGGRRIGSMGYWYGWPQTTPVVQFSGEWLKVRLPERPNGSTAWIKRSGVKFTKSTYRIVIRVSQTSLTVYNSGFPQQTFPVGLGKASTPTPTGNFYLGVIEPQDNASNGQFALASTAHSEAIQSWQGSGDAVIAIHGPVSAKSDRQIGSTGTYISNGCVRMHLGDLEQLYGIPLGTPIDIVP